MTGHDAPMGSESTQRREQFAREARAERPDLALLCLLLAAEGDPALDESGIDTAQMELDRLAGLLPYRPGGPRAWAAALAELLGGRYEFRGSAADYQRLESSLLHEVLRRRRGLPILLSVVWTEVARRAGAPVYGVALPGHFVVGFGPPGDQVLADPFDGGRVLTGTDAELLVSGATGRPLDPSMLHPADPLDVVVRILNNIRAWASTRPERSDVALWALDLSLLLPSHPARLRHERAQLLIQRGEFLTGATELEEYAEVVEPVDAQAAERVRRDARLARARLN
ncbi:transglutaminase-like domain-containing protein [Streptomyces luteolus]